MKKLLFFINALFGGGAEKVLCDLVNSLDKNKYEITVQTIYNEKNSNILLKNHINYKYIFERKSLKSRVVLKLANISNDLSWFYRKYVYSNYDIEVAFLEGFPTKVLAFSENKNKYTWVHTDLYNYYGHKKIFSSVKYNAECYKKYKNIICVSKGIMLGFKKRFGFDNSLILKYNPVNEKIILEKSKESINEIKLNDSFKIVTVGRLVYEKGYDRLLKIHKSLIDNGFKHELWVVGDGNQRSQLEEYINKNNLKESVKLLGFNANPYKFMKNADLFVCSSRVEGLSTVVMEALICGTPVISTNCAGAMDLLGDSLYGVISENNEDALYETIKDMVLNKSKLNFFRAKSIQRGMDFTLERAISEIDNIFENCL